MTSKDGSTNDPDNGEGLADGSPTGDATKDPKQDSDTSSGGEPE